jgi:hypothetical protein
MTPPSTRAIRRQIRMGNLGAIATPAQGNRWEEGWWWCADNGIFTGRYPGDEKYLAWLSRMKPFAPWCLFAVAPDVVANAFATANRCYDMLSRIRDLGYPAAFAAQDYAEFCPYWNWEDLDCLFIGGSTPWKLSPAAANLARVADSILKHVHMGRVNSWRRYRYAHEVAQVHTVDGTFLTRAPDKLLPRVLAWREAILNAPASASPPLLASEDYDPWDGGYDRPRMRRRRLRSTTRRPPRTTRRTRAMAGQLDLFEVNAGLGIWRPTRRL